jgi:hypothetical protein
MCYRECECKQCLLTCRYDTIHGRDIISKTKGKDKMKKYKDEDVDESMEDKVGNGRPTSQSTVNWYCLSEYHPTLYA